MQRILYDFLNLFYPAVCLACGTHLLRHEKTICTHCYVRLPKTQYHLELNNPIARIFWGRAPVVSATAYFHFEKQSNVQNLIHNLKYKGHQEIGITIGEMMGEELLASEIYGKIEAILPVPLHPAKQQLRGYNQASAFAEGLSLGMGLPFYDNVLLRKVFTQTQTRKTRIERWQNVAEAFVVDTAPLGNAKNLLLVDDVITTGATFEACTQALMNSVGNAKVYVSAMASAAKI